MAKRFFTSILFVAWLIISPFAKKLAVVGPVIGFLEFLAIIALIGYVLYHLGLHLYLWCKVRRKK